MHRDLIKPFRGNIDAHLCALAMIAGETPVRLLEEWLDRQFPLPPVRRRRDFATLRRHSIDHASARFLSAVVLVAAIVFFLSSIFFALGLYHAQANDSGVPLVPSVIAGISLALQFGIRLFRPDVPGRRIDPQLTKELLPAGIARTLEVLIRMIVLSAVATMLWVPLVVLLPEPWWWPVGMGVPVCIFMILAARGLVRVVSALRAMWKES